MPRRLRVPHTTVNQSINAINARKHARVLWRHRFVMEHTSRSVMHAVVGVSSFASVFRVVLHRV